MARLEQEEQSARTRDHLLEQQESTFESLQESYEEACESWQELGQLHIQLQEAEKDLDNWIQQEQQLKQDILTLSIQTESMKLQLEQGKKEAVRYASYDMPVMTDGRSLEELEAEFQGLRSKLEASGVEDALRHLEQSRQSLQEKEAMLARQMAAGAYTQADLEHSLQDSRHPEEVQEEIRSLRQQQEKLYQSMNAQAKEMGKLESRLDQLLEKMEEQTGHKEPLPTGQIRTTGLEQLEMEARDKCSHLEWELDRLENNRKTIDRITSASKAVTGSWQLDQDLVYPAEVLEVDQLESVFGRLRARLNQGDQDLDTAIRNNRTELSRLSAHYDRKDDLAATIVQSLLETVSEPLALANAWQEKREKLHMRMELVQQDVANIQKGRDHHVQCLLDYVRKLNQEIKRIDARSTIILSGRPVKLLEVSVPDFETQEEVAKGRLYQLLDNLFEWVRQAPQEKDTQVGKTLTPANLYSQTIGFEQVKIHVRKIEAARTVRIAWHEAGKTSGAEAFLCSFIVVIALLGYQRSWKNELAFEKRPATVLVMDNPFAKSQSSHIIQAMMEIARHGNVQLVAFTAVENASVINAFDNIYNLRLVPRADNRNHLVAEHVKGEEEMETVHLKVTQQTLFEQ